MRTFSFSPRDFLPIDQTSITSYHISCTYSFLLSGRILLIFLFLGFILQGQWSIARVFVSIVGMVACVMVAVGFKAKWSAAFLVVVLSIFNVFVNNFWSLHSALPQRDFLKYDFFQTLCTYIYSVLFQLFDLIANNFLSSLNSYRRWITPSSQPRSRWLLRRREEKELLSSPHHYFLYKHAISGLGARE